ncbi:uncharacterized protein LOC132250371 [Alligator mississippiensis]|uniref:uncharacterized protein LOC132250371 n=1 Tax=Alligator mississippiensis TaxID=8496 RepID=UPI0028777536|nr:uncharacterized protein LOC132250371 [Alligator mississippiensis]
MGTGDISGVGEDFYRDLDSPKGRGSRGAGGDADRAAPPQAEIPSAPPSWRQGTTPTPQTWRHCPGAPIPGSQGAAGGLSVLAGAPALEPFLAVLPRGRRAGRGGERAHLRRGRALAEGFQAGQEQDEKPQVAVSVQAEEVSSHKMPSTAALQDTGDCCLEDPTAHCADRPVEESGERETPGPRDKPPGPQRGVPAPPGLRLRRPKGLLHKVKLQVES